ncbi:secondary carrier transporter [Lithospermum erythrorhizon]|uniref:Secondary carrier transporter n=1 Tax=Lithospermum erythrorhizon TaxID=34254 RepID=A0AAV3Q5S2_LITER
MPRLGWRWLTVSSSLTPLIVILIGCVVPESLSYLCMKGKTSEAYKVLEKVAIFNRTKVPPGVLILSPLIQKDEEHSSSEEENNQQDDTSYGNIFINSLEEMSSAFIAIAIVDRVGQKLSIVMTSTLSFFLLLPLAWHQSDIATTVLLFGSRLFVAAGMTIVGVYVNEAYPTSVRSTGTGVMCSIGNIGGVVCPLIAIVLVEGCHQGASVSLFEFVILLMIVSVLMIPVETSGRELVYSILIMYNSQSL